MIEMLSTTRIYIATIATGWLLTFCITPLIMTVMISHCWVLMSSVPCTATHNISSATADLQLCLITKYLVNRW